MSDRALASAVAAFASGILAVDTGLRGSPGLLVTLAAALALAAILAARGERRRSAWIVGLVLMGVLGALRLELRFAVAEEDRARLARIESHDTAIRAPPARLDRVHSVEARVRSRVQRAWGLEVVLDALCDPRARARLPRLAVLRVSTQDVAARADRLLMPGARIRAGLRLSPIEGRRNPGTPDREAAWRRRGLSVRARLVDPAWIVAIDPATDGAAPPIREVLLDRTSRVLGDRPGGGLARALVLGDRSALDPRSVEAFRRLGLSHTLAISGLHVGLLGAGVAFLSLWPCRRVLGRGARPGAERTWATAVGAVAAWGYMALAGGGPAVQRAALLFAAVVGAALLRRDLSAGRALLWVGFGLLALEPAWLFDLGARLTFSACAGIVLARPATALEARGAAALGRLRAWGEASLRTTLAASFGTAVWLGSVGLPLSPWGAAANLLAIPALGLVVLPGAFGAVIAAALADPPEAGAMGSALVAGIEGLLAPARSYEAAVVLAADRLASAPPPPHLLSPAMLSLACWVGLWMLRRERWIAALALWTAITCLGSVPAPGRGAMAKLPRVAYLDVGQGDSILLQGRSGAVLVDTGGGGGRLTRALRTLGVRRLDALVVTHGDADHRAGAEALLGAFSVGELWLPAVGPPRDPRLASLVEAASTQPIPVRRLAAGDSVLVGELRFDVLWPGSAADVDMTAGRLGGNEESLVLRAEVGGRRHLLAADIGAATERRLLREVGAGLRADVLKVGHHGSAGSTTREFVERVAPRLAVLSAPCRPRRGLPNPVVLDRLQDAGVPVAWTGRDGAVSIGPGGREREANVFGEADPSARGFVAWAAVRRCPGDPKASTQPGGESRPPSVR